MFCTSDILFDTLISSSFHIYQLSNYIFLCDILKPKYVTDMRFFCFEMLLVLYILFFAADLNVVSIYANK